MPDTPSTLIKPWKGFYGLRTYTPELRRDLEELDSFIKDIRQAVGKMVGEVSITNTTTTVVVSSRTIFADYGLDGGGPLTADVHLSVDPELDATGTEAWTGSHAWQPSSDDEPVTIKKTVDLVTGDLVRIVDLDDTPLFVVDNIGLVGVNCEPDSMTTIQGASSALTPVGSPIAWYKADTIGVGDGNNVVTWADSSGNGNNLTAAGSTLGNGASSVRPKWNAAASAKATTYLPSVSFEGNNIFPLSQAGYFTFDTGFLALTAAAGWTIGMIVRDYDATITNASTYFGASVPAGDAAGDTIYATFGAMGTTNYINQEGAVVAGDKNYSTIFSHTNGNDVEVIVLRVNATGSGLRCWVDGTLITPTTDTHTSNLHVRYIGRHLPTVGSVSGNYNKAVAEIVIYNTALSDGNVATLNTYLLNRVAGTGSGTAYDLTRWKSSAGTVLSRIDENGQFGFGVDPAFPIHVLQTSTQEKIGYDGSNYYTTSVSSTGVVTFDAAGSGASFVFADPVSITGSITTSTSIFLPYTTSSSLGIIFKNSLAWAHDFTNPTSFTDASLDTLANARNVFLGFKAGNFTISGTSTQGKANVGIGHYALNAATTGSNNVAIGRQALELATTGAANMAVGAGALGVLVGGSANVGMGIAALGAVTSGSENVGVGDSAGITVTTGSNNVFIGAATDATGNFTNAIALGYGVTVSASNKMVLGNTSLDDTVINGSTVTIPTVATATNGGSTAIFDGGVDGGLVTIVGGDGLSGTTDGGSIYIKAGDRSGSGTAGAITLQASGVGGEILVWANNNITLKSDGGGQYLFYNPTNNTYVGELDFDSLTSSTRKYTYPDKSGELVLITAGTSLNNHVLSFVNNDTNDPTGIPNYVGIYAGVIHSNTAQTFARALGIVGSVSVRTATGLTATMVNGVVGAVSSNIAASLSGKVLSCFSGALSQQGGQSTDEITTKDISFGMSNHPAGGYDHLTVLWAPNFSSASATGYPSDTPAVSSSARLTIQDWGAPTTDASNTKEYWAIYGETGTGTGGVWGADETFPAVTGYLRMVYPRRFNKTSGGQARAMHAWWEPWPNTSTIRAANVAGDTYFDDGTNFGSGLWQRDATGWVKLLNDDLLFYDNEIVSYDDESVGYH